MLKVFGVCRCLLHVARSVLFVVKKIVGPLLAICFRLLRVVRCLPFVVNSVVCVVRCLLYAL